MSIINIDNYIKSRLEEQITWYDQKSIYNKFRYRIFQIIIIIASALIPLINLTSSAFPTAQNGALITSAI